MRLILVRHGQTPSNVAGLLDTAPPGPGLTELGVRQAAAIPTALSDQPVDAIFTSNQTRARQTAAPLAEARNLGIATLPGLREIAAGELEMAGDADSVHRYIGTLIRWIEGDLAERIPGGPDGHEFLHRYDEAIAAIVEQLLDEVGPDGSAVAVSHGAAIRAWASSRAVNAEVAVLAPPASGVGSRTNATIAPAGAGHRHLDNTGAITLDRGDAGEWTIRDWRAEALGGAALDQPAASGPTG